MKLLCIIFSFFVVLLSVSPCCTDSDCDKSAKTEKNGTGKAKDCAGCSPFFSCGSCPGFTLNAASVLTLPANLTGAVQTYPAYQQPDIKDVVLAIWQPPQLA